MAEAEPVGSLADEAVKLLRAVADSSATDHTCTTSWCPVCRAVGYVRDNPELVDQATRMGVELLRSVRDAVETIVTTPRSTS